MKIQIWNYCKKRQQKIRQDNFKYNIKSAYSKLKLTMDYRKSDQDHLQNYPYSQTQEERSFKIQTTKKALIRQKQTEVDELSPTDRIHTQDQRPYQSKQLSQQSDCANTYTPYNSEPSEYQFLIYQNKINLLEDRLQCFIDEVQNLKKTNAILISKLSTIQSLDEELQNQKLKNLQLREQIETYRDRIQDEKDQYQLQINELKVKIQEKDHFFELLRQQNAKIMRKKDQQIQLLKQALRQKSLQIDSYEKQIHSIQIERLNTSDDFFSRDSLFTKKSAMSQYNMRNSESNTTSIQQSSISVEEKARQFVKKNQTELKIAMKSISHAQKCLEIGGQQISTIMVDKENEKSLINMSRLQKSKVNKTYYK